MVRLLMLSCLAGLLSASPAVGQDTAPAQALTVEPSLPARLLNSQQLRFEQVSTNHWRMTGQVEIEGEDGVTFFADDVDVFLDTNRLVATGNVLFTNPDSRISAERLEFDTGSQTGTFFDASGLLSLGPGADRAQFGNQEPDVYFYGETIQKTGPRQYRLTRGGFTTCVQPTPRWEVTAGSVVLNLDDYAIARHTVLRVKGVPLLYVPFLYYPIQDEDRATGFLMPTYGASTLRGQTLSNAFFWVLGRSHDMTLFHDWFTQAGQGAGTEYRYVTGQQSSGTVRLYRFGQRETGTLPASTSYQLSGTATQAIARGIYARARVDYFSDIVNQQLYQQDVYQASRTTRVLEAGVSTARGPLSTSVLYQRNENFGSAASSVTYGSTPRVTAGLAPQRLFGTPLYGSVQSEYAYLPFRHVTGDIVTRDDSLHRLDLAPNVRVALAPTGFLSLNTSATYRSTYYSRSNDGTGSTVSRPSLRRYVELGTALIGPVFNRIWDGSSTGDAVDRLKHVVEPLLGVDFTSGVTQSTPILSDLSDVVVGGSFRMTYGVTNRFFRSPGTTGGSRGQAREFATIGLQQTYYWNPEASLFDTRYMSAQGAGAAARMSPIALNARIAPSSILDANARLEYDVSRGDGLQAITTGGTMTWGAGSTNVNYSRRQFQWFTQAENFLSSSTTTRLLDGRATGTYALSWDMGRGYIVSQSVTTAYLAQCCGIQVEFQTFNFPPTLGLPISADRRLNVSIVLAGIGTFSNFFGAFGGLR